MFKVQNSTSLKATARVPVKLFLSYPAERNQPMVTERHGLEIREDCFLAATAGIYEVGRL